MKVLLIGIAVVAGLASLVACGDESSSTGGSDIGTGGNGMGTGANGMGTGGNDVGTGTGGSDTGTGNQGGAGGQGGAGTVDCEGLSERQCSSEDDCEVLLGTVLEHPNEAKYAGCRWSGSGPEYFACNSALSCGVHPETGVCWLFGNDCAPDGWESIYAGMEMPEPFPNDCQEPCSLWAPK